MPLALLLSTHVRTDLAAMVKKLAYVESTEILGVRRITSPGARSLWTSSSDSEGKRPLPLRVIITYKLEPGQPRFWADLSDWNTVHS